MTLRIWHKILILMLIPISFEIAATAVLVYVLNSTQTTADRFHNSRKLLSDYHSMQNHFNSAAIDIATVGVYREDGSPPAFEEDKHRIQLAKIGVTNAADIHPSVREALNAAPAVFDHAMELIDKAKKIYEDPFIPKRKKGSLLKDNVFDLIMESDPLVKRVVDVETTIETLEASELERARWLVIGSAAVAFCCSLFISFLVAMVFYRSFGKRLQQIESNAEKVALAQPLPTALSGGDEIDELDRTLHAAAQFIEGAHEREFAVLNKSVDVIFSIDNRFKIVSIGESVQNSWHYPVSDVLGRSILTMLPEEEVSRLRIFLSEITNLDTERDFEVELRCGDGKTREFTWKVTWDPRENKFFCVARDISERKSIERSKQRLLAIASHDLRTPLMSVSANLSSLAAGRFGEIEQRLSTALVDSEENLDKLMDLIQSLLDLERLEATKTRLELSCVSALDVSSEAISLTESQARKANVQLNISGRDESVLADERRLVQILSNLLQNALSQSVAGQSVTLSIDTTPDTVRFSVTDRGPGLAPEEVDLVFERYFQSRNESQKRNRTSGLNLALAKVLTEAQNGTIDVTSEQGKGSTFTVSLARFILPDREGN